MNPSKLTSFTDPMVLWKRIQIKQPYWYSWWTKKVVRSKNHWHK